MANFLDLFSPKGRFREGIKALHDFIASKGEPLGLASLNSAGKVPTAQLPDMSVADGSITEAKIAVGAVTTGKIAGLNVVTAHIADGAVTSVKQADGSITGSKLAASLSRAMTLLGGPALRFDGTMASGGTGTTQVPVWYFAANGATEPTTWNTAGTWLGLNAPAGFTGRFIDCRINGGSPVFFIRANGANSSVSAGMEGFYALDGSGNNAANFSAYEVKLGSLTIKWAASFGAAVDTGLSRSAAGVLEINNGTVGARRDLAARRLNLNGLPTSASGLLAGDIWNDAGTLKIA